MQCTHSFNSEQSQARDGPRPQLLIQLQPRNQEGGVAVSGNQEGGVAPSGYGRKKVIKTQTASADKKKIPHYQVFIEREATIDELSDM